MRIPFSCDIPILKSAFAFVLVAIVVCPLTAQNSPATQCSGHVTLTYMGTAAWEISDGNTVILLDPYLSRILLPIPGAGSAASGRAAGDTRPEHRWNEVVPPDVATIDAHIRRADFVLVIDTHIDHVMDVRHIALKTHATVIGTESTQNVMRAYNVPEDQFITVRGGEDYEFGKFSLWNACDF